MQNEAKRSEKDAKTNSKLARGSKTKQNKVRFLQNTSKPKRNMRKVSQFCMFRFCCSPMDLRWHPYFISDMEGSRVSLFCFKTKDAKRSETKQKRCENKL
jgi:hypothetical protein